MKGLKQLKVKKSHLCRGVTHIEREVEGKSVVQWGVLADPVEVVRDLTF